MGLSEVLKSVQVVLGPDGKPSAIQLGIEAWESVLDWLEDADDRAIVKERISRLREGPRRGRAIAWTQARREWESMEGEPRSDAP
jgi:hypothetical protein